MPVIVSNYGALCEALRSGAAHICFENFCTTGEETARVVIDHPVHLEGAQSVIDFGLEICSGGVTVEGFHIHTQTFEKAVSAPGKQPGRPGDCLAIEIRSSQSNGHLPVVIRGNTIRHEVLNNMNSAIYISDGCFVEIEDNDITVEDKMDNRALERGGIFIGRGVRGHIRGNTICAARTGFPTTPYGLRASLDHVSGPMALPEVVICGNRVCSTYFSKLYVSGAFFGEDGRVLTAAEDFGTRSALEGFAHRLWTENTFTPRFAEYAQGEGPMVQPRLDRIAAGAPRNECYIYFEMQDGKAVRV